LYRIERQSNNGPFVEIGTSPSSDLTDATVSPSTAYLYRVRAVDGDANVSAYSNVDLATTILFADDPLVAGQTSIRAMHVIQLRAAIDAVRASAGLTASTWTRDSLVGMTVTALDVEEMRNNLTPALTALGFAAPMYTDTNLASAIIKSVHIQELRQLVK
jgi:hypothetical protein